MTKLIEERQRRTAKAMVAKLDTYIDVHGESKKTFVELKDIIQHLIGEFGKMHMISKIKNRERGER